jgi:hypothetical protein
VDAGIINIVSTANSLLDKTIYDDVSQDAITAPTEEPADVPATEELSPVATEDVESVPESTEIVEPPVNEEDAVPEPVEPSHIEEHVIDGTEAAAAATLVVGGIHEAVETESRAEKPAITDEATEKVLPHIDDASPATPEVIEREVVPEVTESVHADEPEIANEESPVDDEPVEDEKDTAPQEPESLEPPEVVEHEFAPETHDNVGEVQPDIAGEEPPMEDETVDDDEQEEQETVSRETEAADAPEVEQDTSIPVPVDDTADEDLVAQASEPVEADEPIEHEGTEVHEPTATEEFILEEHKEEVDDGNQSMTYLTSSGPRGRISYI